MYMEFCRRQRQVLNFAESISFYRKILATPLASGDHPINQERHAIRYSGRSDEYHDASRHALGDAHVVKPTPNEVGCREKCDGRQRYVQHPASITKTSRKVLFGQTRHGLGV